MTTACFRFYAELNEFLPHHRRGREFCVPCAQDSTTKHMIEALGVPHTEVDLVLVDGHPSGFAHSLQQGERVSVYPRFTSLDIASLPPLGERRARAGEFIADSHLGALARLLRMAGFDTLYRNDYADREIVGIAAAQSRIILTRDRDLLKRCAVTDGCYIHATLPVQQFGELAHRLDLARHMQPFTRCLQCNSPLHEVAKDAVRERLPPSVLANQTRFTRCLVCRRIFWPGTHWQRMRDLLKAALRSS